MQEEEVIHVRRNKFVNAILDSEGLRVLLFEFVATALLMFMATSVATLPPSEDHPYNINAYRLVYVVIIVYVIICFFGPITGAHINPAVSLGLIIFKKRDNKLKILLLYWLAQILGGLLGVILSHNIYGNGHAVFDSMPDTIELIKLCTEEWIGTLLFVFLILLITTEETTFVYD